MKDSLGAHKSSFIPSRSGHCSGLKKATHAFGTQSMSATASDAMLPMSGSHPPTLSDASTSVTPGLSSNTPHTPTRSPTALVIMELRILTSTESEHQLMW